MKISVIVVNYNAEDFIKDCVDSVLMQKNVQHEIIVLDNASQDNSLKILRQYGDKIKLIESLDNLGFGKGNNAAAKIAAGEYLFLLNPDAKLLKHDDLENIVQFVDSNHQYGLMSTNVQNPPGREETIVKYQYPCEKYFGAFQANLPGKIAWVVGPSMVVPKSVYEKVSGFDEDFFLYGEETDLCLRIRKAGFEIGYLPEVTVWHYDGGSEKNERIYDTVTRREKGFCLFCRKHYGEQVALLIVKTLLRRAKYRLFIYNVLSFFKRDKFKQKQACYMAKRDCYKGIINIASMLL